VSAAGEKIPVLVSPRKVSDGLAADPNASSNLLPGIGVPICTGSPRYKTEMLFVPVGGAGENVIVVPMTEYRLGFCTTPLIATMIEVVLAGA
jgi:hypothetical protein